MEVTSNIVEVLESGEIKFAGRLISSEDFLVGTTLCNLQNDDRSEEDKLEEAVSSETLEKNMSPLNTVIERETLKSAPIRRRKRKFVPKVIRLHADDVRLTYARDYFAAMNNADGDEFEKMLRRIAIPKLVMVSRKLNPTPDYMFPAHLEIVGIEANIQLFKIQFTAMPDMMVEDITEKINLYENGESSIETTCRFSGSKVFSVEGMEEGIQEKVVLKSEVDFLSDSLDSMNFSTKTIANVELGSGSTFKVPLKLGDAQTKSKLDNYYNITFHLNVNKKVFLIITTTA